MKNYIIPALVLAASVIFAPTCQKSPSLPQFSETTEKPFDVPSSDRTDCDFDCPLTLFVEVANWSTVSSLRVTYQNANTGMLGIVVFTSVTPISVNVCAAIGTVTLQVNGGPAAVAVKDDMATGNSTIYLTNPNSSGTVNCSAYLNACGTGDPWIPGNCGLID